MSTENRKRVLLGFGALAVVVVVALAIWAPSFRNEDASGAIGAVQKHRAPQITRQDVVLGSEATRQRQNVLYGDFLKDSAKLQSISALVAAKNFAEAGKQLKETEIELMARYTAYAKQAVAAAKSMSREQAANTELANDIEAAGALAARQELSESDITALNVKLAHIAELLARQEAAARGARGAKHELADAVAEMNHRLAARELQDSELAARSLMADAEYLAAVSLEMKTLNDVETELAQRMASQAEIQFADIETELAVRAEELASRAVKNMEAQFNNEIEMAAFFRDIDAQLAAAKAQAGSQAAVASRSERYNQELADIEQTLAARKQQASAMAASDIQFELAAIGEYLNQRNQANARQARSEAQLSHMLADLETQLASNTALAAMLQDEEQFAAKAHELGARTRPVRSRQPSRRRAF